jgi:GAF domain-containing protein
MPIEPAPELREARGSGGQPPESGLARELSALARQMQAETSTEAVLQRIVEAAVTEVGPADYAGISETNGQLFTRAATDRLVHEIDHLQYEADDGPCVSSLREQTTVRSNDLSAEGRWPRFAPAAVRHGVLAMLSVQLFVEGSNLGALNLYSTSRHAFDEHHESTAMLLAAHAAIAMKGSQVEHNLRIAVRSRDLIGQAKGILMERFKLSETEAFDLLVIASQRANRKLREIAEELAATGVLEAGQRNVHQ